MLLEKTVTNSTYTASVFAVISAMTLTDWGILVGILTAIGTFLLNYYFQRRRDRREQKLHDLKVQHLKDVCEVD